MKILKLLGGLTLFQFSLSSVLHKTLPPLHFHNPLTLCAALHHHSTDVTQHHHHHRRAPLPSQAPIRHATKQAPDNWIRRCTIDVVVQFPLVKIIKDVSLQIFIFRSFKDLVSIYLVNCDAYYSDPDLKQKIFTVFICYFFLNTDRGKLFNDLPIIFCFLFKSFSCKWEVYSSKCYSYLLLYKITEIDMCSEFSSSRNETCNSECLPLAANAYQESCIYNQCILYLDQKILLLLVNNCIFLIFFFLLIYFYSYF